VQPAGGSGVGNEQATWDDPCWIGDRKWFGRDGQRVTARWGESLTNDATGAKAGYKT